MANTIQFRRTTTSGGTPPQDAARPGEPLAVLDQTGSVDLYVRDNAGTAVLINPAPTPIGGVEFAYRWNSDQNVATPPASGDVKIDGAQDPLGSPTASTMSIHNTTRLGTNTDPFWPLVKAGDYIGLFESGGGGGSGGETFYWEVTGAPVDQGTYWDVPGATAFWQGNDIDNNRPTSVFWIQNPANLASSYTDLDDTPADYTGAAGRVVTVNQAEDGLVQDGDIDGGVYA